MTSTRYFHICLHSIVTKAKQPTNKTMPKEYIYLGDRTTAY